PAPAGPAARGAGARAAHGRARRPAPGRARHHDVPRLAGRAAHAARVRAMTGPGATTGPEEVARAFQAERPRLLRLAYATTGSWSAAEDCVQDAWLRLRTQDPAAIRHLPASRTPA